MKRLIIFDFDGTLIDSPFPEIGKEKWEKYYDKPFPTKGWWGCKESLDTDVFDIKPFPTILNILNGEKGEPNTDVIILSSRVVKLRGEIENVLKLNNIVVDDIVLKSGRKGKGELILDILKYNSDLKEIIVYDDFMEGDRDKIAEYVDIIDELPSDVKYRLYMVDNGRVSLLENRIQLLNIIYNEINNLML